jgi:hypothetical protein
VIGLDNLLHARRNKETLQRYPHLRVEQANEKAQEAYIPKPYKGRVLMVKPKTFFAGHEQEYFGWRDILGENLEIETGHLPPGDACRTVCPNPRTKNQAALAK